MSNLAIIGGTGLTTLENLEIVSRQIMQTPYGEPSAPLSIGNLAGREVMFLPRHGYGHTIPPHKVNYRANIWALKEAGATNIIAVAAVGGIRNDLVPKSIMVPDQIIDYTWSRITTYFEEGLNQVTHIDFTEPYSPRLRDIIINACKEMGIAIFEKGTYAATQGPRLETTAEINRLERDGCDIVGMTGMPEAALARELDLEYATIAVVANAAAGRGNEPLTMDKIQENLSSGIENVKNIIAGVIKANAL
ncbi:MAG: S-methyl-5'-thioinosine phosphorylase [Gammaproteobacteria bacterium]|nr:S-methyl-5'-thioinosine phosphorylase [Gammaproteobacteria bacterium]